MNWFISVVRLILLSAGAHGLHVALQLLIASRFGTGREVDAYTAAVVLPALLGVLLAGNLTPLLVPVYMREAASGSRRTIGRLHNGVVNLSLLVIGLAAVPCLFAPKAVIEMLTPGLDPATHARAAEFLGVLLAAELFSVIGLFISQLYFAGKRFAVPAALGVGANVIPLAAVAAAGPEVGLTSLVWGQLMANAAAALILYIALGRDRVGYRLGLPLREPALRRVLALAVPIFIGAASARVNVTVDRFFVSYLEQGSLALLGYADKITQVAQVLLILPVSLVVYPYLSEKAAARNDTEFWETLIRGIRLVLFLTLPASVALILLAQPLAEAFFQRGAFSAEAARLLAPVIAAYAGIIALAGVGSLLMRAFYALGRTVEPMIWGGLVPIGLNAFLDWLLIRPLGLPGVALVTSLNALVGIPILYGLLRRRVPCQTPIRLGGFMVRLAAACGAMAAVVLLVGHAAGLREGAASLWGPLIATGVAGSVTYLGVAGFLRLDEVRYFASIFRLAALRPDGKVPEGEPEGAG